MRGYSLLPKLLLFAPCEKVIVDQNNVTSLITILEEITVDIPATLDADVEKTPVAPLKWDVIALWAETEGDEPGTIFQMRLALIDPTGAPVGLEGSAEFRFADKPHHRVVLTILGFPIRHEGFYSVRLWEQKKGESEGKPMAEFPIKLTRKRPKE